MDGDRFDRLTTTLAGLGSRRTTVRLLTPAGGAPTCLDTSSDPQNCGGCNKVCDEDEVCRNGRCRSNCPGEAANAARRVY